MEVEKFEILENLEYNDVIVLKVISGNDLLTEVLFQEIKTPIPNLYESALNKTTDDNTSDLLGRIFKTLILTDKKEIQNYKKIADELQIPIDIVSENEEVIVSDEVEEAPTETKSKKPLKYPRRFGVEKVKEQIKAQGGEATIPQTSMIYSNHLKNMHVRVNNLIIKDLHDEERLLSDAEHLAFIAAVRIFENKVKNIFKKKL